MAKSQTAATGPTKDRKANRKQAARVNDVSPEVAGRLAELAGEMRQLLSGGEGVPEWGTKFTEIEADGMTVGLELARLIMEQSVREQAAEVPDEALQHEGEAAGTSGAVHESALETKAGEVGWEQPKTRWRQRDFFPSDEGVGHQR